MKDKDFLIWLHERLTDVHGESTYADYMHKLRAIIRDTPDDRISKNCNTGNGLADLSDIMRANLS